ncbi:MAG: adenylate/guanylate cyclase domain-containing protein [SAR324 cluster bacterium]|nr:adenylate/guanylate cyclase domain-containing protein [SAR324 cluster bacterium]
MSVQETKRKLAAILAADVVGYSRLMGLDDEGTLRDLTECRDLFSSQAGQYRGRIVNTHGDAVLAEFAAVVDAVNCAVAVQKALAERGAKQPEDRRMRFRIGVNLGDVLEEGGDIFGDGVNIAARLESLAKPGGICISGSVYEQVATRLPFSFEDLGAQTVKNIARPVRVYRVLLEGADEPGERDKSQGGSESPPLVEKPSIAVLAFDNMSGDPEQDYFSDGISEDIITDLSKLSGLLVIARTSSFSYKGQKVDLRQMGEDLGVRFILEGSVRKAGNRVRITAQLIEAETGQHLWADRFDRGIEDIFAVQDEITEEIVTALNVTLVSGEQARIWRKSLRNPKARELFYQGRDVLNKMTREAVSQAIGRFEQVIALAPDSPFGHAWLGLAHWVLVFRNWSENPGETLQTVIAHTKTALELDAENAEAHAIMGCALLLLRNFDEALQHAEHAVRLAPNSADVLQNSALICMMYGNFDQSIDLCRRALRLSPTTQSLLLNILGVSYREAGRFEDGIAILRRALALEPEYTPARFALLTVYCAAGRVEEARNTAREIAEIDPAFSLAEYTKRLPFRDAAVNERLMEQLKAAGVV